MQMKDLIWTQRNSLTSDFCRHVIQKFESDQRKYPGKVIGDGTDSDSNIQPQYKVSTDLYITRLSDWNSEDTIFYQSLQPAVQDYIKYCNSFNPELMASFHDDKHDVGYQIQKTKPGEFYTWHSDWHYDMNNGYRIFTYIWYLNDIFDEGETEFIDGTKIKPEEGKLLIFPATWEYVHRGVSPKSETKYISTGWIYQRFQRSEVNVKGN